VARTLEPLQGAARVRQKRAHGAVPPWHYTSLRRCTQASPSGRSWVETGGFLMSSPSRPTRARRTSLASAVAVRAHCCGWQVTHPNSAMVHT